MHPNSSTSPVSPWSTSQADLPEHLDTPWAIAAWEERRLSDALGGMADVAQHIHGITCTFNAPGSWINQAVDVPVHVLSVEQIEDVAQFFVARGAEPKICVTPYIHPETLASLAQAGFVLRTIEHVLAVNLASVADTPAPLPVPDLRLDPVDRGDGIQVAEYVKVHCQGFYGDTENPVLAEAARRGLQHPRAQGFVLRVGAEAVGVAAIETFGPLGALYGAAVLPAWRRKGIQRFALEARLQALRSQGIQVATIGSLPAASTERNALRAGLRPNHVRLEMVRPGPGLVPSP